ncbi:MAG TPA: DUF6526 family protein [Longimicrobiales bacterium]|nr:DUF6526 family protein [Longimicrobiales bacterium]
MSAAPQSYENHAKMVPMFHGVTFGLLVINLAWTGVRAFRDFSTGTFVALLLAVALILVMFWARLFALGVQDRVIRLEERLRMAQLLPDDLKPRIGDFTTEQLIALRFASDEELPGLARRVLNEGITDRKTIKQAVKNWRADHQRI